MTLVARDFHILLVVEIVHNAGVVEKGGNVGSEVVPLCSFTQHERRAVAHGEDVREVAMHGDKSIASFEEECGRNEGVFEILRLVGHEIFDEVRDHFRVRLRDKEVFLGDFQFIGDKRT